ncbi:MAG TPA: hypothetical protein VEV15_05640 [Flavisolibacter sp.]|nr:hypothetical protein [Flavisolibacter sp.]
MLKPLFSLIFISSFIVKTYGQEEEPATTLIKINSNALFGKVVDGKTNKGLRPYPFNCTL